MAYNHGLPSLNQCVRAFSLYKVLVTHDHLRSWTEPAHMHESYVGNSSRTSSSMAGIHSLAEFGAVTECLALRFGTVSAVVDHCLSAAES
jgi:hypothetical protein